MDFTVVARAKVTQAEFAALCGVSRVTANTWVMGAPPNRFVTERVRKVLRTIEIACTYNMLPLPKTPKPEREAAIGDALKGALIRFAGENRATAAAAA